MTYPECKYCEGRGYIAYLDENNQQMDDTSECLVCSGTGFVKDDPDHWDKAALDREFEKIDWSGDE